MKKVAIVVQRCHPAIVGGSETLAWHYATLIRDHYSAEVLTTTALDTAVWANTLPAGSEERDGVTLRRFAVTVGRSRYWEKIYQRLLSDFSTYNVGRPGSSDGPRYLPWSIPLQEEFIKHQGPFSAPLTEYLRWHWQDYHALIFVTYLYPTTYFGMMEVPRGCALFAPTLHDEQPARLSAYKHMAHRARAIIWLTEAEGRVGVNLWGNLPGKVVAMAIDTEPRVPAKSAVPYLLYCGRIDPNKGSTQLFDYFIRFKREFPSRLRLLLTGKNDVPVPSHRDIEFRGMVKSEEKFRLMGGAKLFVIPSANESFSIVTLEAMAQGTPVLAYDKSEVLTDHVKFSGAGSVYRDYETFSTELNRLLADSNLLSQMGARGREYVVSNFRPDKVRAALVEMIESACPNGPEAPGD